MKNTDMVRKNLSLHSEFMKYAFEHPEVLDNIPKGAALVILPDNDKELAKENAKIIESAKEKGLPVAIVRMEIPKMVVPRIEAVAV